MDLRRSLALIRKLDDKSNQVISDVDAKLRQLQHTDVDSDDRATLVEDISRLFNDWKVLRLNTVSEAQYLEDTVVCATHKAQYEILKHDPDAFERQKKAPISNRADSARKNKQQRERTERKGGLNDVQKTIHKRDFRQRKKLTMPKEEPEPTYCICNRPSFGEMIACEDPKCKIEWYHYSCMGIRRAPKGDWYCPDCLARRQKEQQAKASNRPNRRTRRR